MITTDFVIKKHKLIIEGADEPTSTDTILNFSSLDGAINSVYASFEGRDIYLTNELKCLRMLYTLTKAHAFADGNKRIAAYIFIFMTRALNTNIKPSEKQLIDITRGIADNSISWEDLCKKFNVEILNESDGSIRYSYTGPIFRFGQVWDFIDEPVYTEAKTKRQAVNNLTFQAKMLYGLDRDCNLTIYTPYVKEEPFTTKEYHNIMKQISKETPKQKCQNCGTELNSLGDCPVCDYGEEDMLED